MESESSWKLDVAVEHELPWVRSKRDLVDLFLALVFDPGVDDVLREYAAFEQERVVLLECVGCLAERAWHLLDLGHLLAFELVDVLVERSRRSDLVLDSVESRHQAGREREVRAGSGVRRAEFDALRLRVG